MERAANYLNDLLGKRAIDVTVGELADALLAKMDSLHNEKNPERHLASGIKGIMECFKCGKSKAAKIKKSGVIDQAITSTGRGFLVDVDLALELMGKKKGGRR